uniref:Uncharacterized protein n=1 Tax=Cyprinodon variegatus TaxID=28743 RepID=A0A3Q2D477_CYPVA
MFEVQMFCFLQRYEELRVVGVPSTVCHGQDAGSSVPDVEVFVLKSGTIDGFNDTMGRVLHAFYILCILFSHLTHEVWYDPMEDGVLQSETFLSSAQNPKVLCSLGNNIGHFEEHQRVSVFGVLLDSGHVWH